MSGLSVSLARLAGLFLAQISLALRLLFKIEMRWDNTNTDARAHTGAAGFMLGSIK